ncbi:hypothetical protein [Streptomyces mayteni]
MATVYTVEEYNHLASLPFGSDKLEEFTWCALEGGHEGPWHWAHGQTSTNGPTWIRWHATARELIRHPNCPKDSKNPELVDAEACTLPEGHPGRHGYEFDLHVDRFAQHRALTVGDLRQALEGLSDDTPIRMGAVTAGTLPEDVECLLADVGRIASVEETESDRSATQSPGRIASDMTFWGR